MARYINDVRILQYRDDIPGKNPGQLADVPNLAVSSSAGWSNHLTASRNQFGQECNKRA